MSEGFGTFGDDTPAVLIGLEAVGSFCNAFPLNSLRPRCIFPAIRAARNPAPVASFDNVCHDAYCPAPMKPNSAVDLGAWLRALRQTGGKTLREVAAAAVMDPAVLSKIERGNRLPTPTQATALARNFGIPETNIQARRIAVDFITRHGWGEPQREALALIQTAYDKQGTRDAR